MKKNDNLMVLACMVTLLVGACPVFGATSEGVEQYDDVEDAQAYYVGMGDGSRQAMTEADIAVSGAKVCAKAIAAGAMLFLTRLAIQKKELSYTTVGSVMWGSYLALRNAYDELVCFKEGTYGENSGDIKDKNEVESKSAFRAVASGFAAYKLGFWALNLIKNLTYDRGAVVNGFNGLCQLSVIWGAYLAACDSYENW